MAFKHDPVIVGLRSGTKATSAPRGGLGRPTSPTPTVPPANVPPPANSPPPTGPAATTPGKTEEEWRVAYTELYTLTQQRERKLQWIAAISGAAGLGVGMAFGAWQGIRRSTRALPEPE